MSTPKPRAPRVRIVCNECGRRSTVGAQSAPPLCARCGGADCDVVDKHGTPQGAAA